MFFLFLQLLNIKTIEEGNVEAKFCNDWKFKNIFQIKDNTIALTVTSPPYHNAINYQEHQDTKKWYRGTVEVSIEDWLEEMKSVFSEVYRCN